MAESEEVDLAKVKTEPSDENTQYPVKKGDEDGELKEDEDGDALPHHEAMKRVHDTIVDLIKIDPLLRDLPAGVTLEEVNSAIAVEYGQAMIVNINRADGETLKVTVVQDANVQDLKHAIQRHVTLKQSRRGGTTQISWRYVWRTYWLYYNGLKLSQNQRSLKSYGIRNRDEITFIKKLRQKRREV